LERAKYSEAAKITETPAYLTGVQGAADRGLRLLRRMRSCWWPHTQSGRCVKDTPVSVLEISRNIGIRWSTVFLIIHDQPPTQFKTFVLSFRLMMYCQVV